MSNKYRNYTALEVDMAEAIKNLTLSVDALLIAEEKADAEQINMAKSSLDKCRSDAINLLDENNMLSKHISSQFPDRKKKYWESVVSAFSRNLSDLLSTILAVYLGIYIFNITDSIVIMSISAFAVFVGVIWFIAVLWCPDADILPNNHKGKDNVSRDHKIKYRSQ